MRDASDDGRNGSLRVVVTDATGAGVARAEVRAVGADAKMRMIPTNSSGVAQFVDLPVGQCDVTVLSPGFQIWKGRRGVSWESGRLAVSLEVGNVGEFLNVPMVVAPPRVPVLGKPVKKRKRWWRKH